MVITLSDKISLSFFQTKRKATFLLSKQIFHCKWEYWVLSKCFLLKFLNVKSSKKRASLPKMVLNWKLSRLKPCVWNFTFLHYFIIEIWTFPEDSPPPFDAIEKNFSIYYKNLLLNKINVDTALCSFKFSSLYMSLEPFKIVWT